MFNILIKLHIIHTSEKKSIILPKHEETKHKTHKALNCGLNCSFLVNERET